MLWSKWLTEQMKIELCPMRWGPQHQWTEEQSKFQKRRPYLQRKQQSPGHLRTGAQTWSVIPSTCVWGMFFSWPSLTISFTEALWKMEGKNSEMKERRVRLNVGEKMQVMKEDSGIFSMSLERKLIKTALECQELCWFPLPLCLFLTPLPSLLTHSHILVVLTHGTSL